jgi:hypothetical protein
MHPHKTYVCIYRVSVPSLICSSFVSDGDQDFNDGKTRACTPQRNAMQAEWHGEVLQ